jgi:hypothetical protein
MRMAITLALAASATLAQAQDGALHRSPSAKPLQPLLQSPTRVAATPEGDVLVTDYRRQRVFVLRSESLASVSEFPVAGRPLAVGAYANRIYVGNETTRSIEVYDRAGQLLGTLGSGRAAVAQATDLAIDETLDLLFAVDGEAKEVAVFSLANGQRVGTVSGPGTTVSTLQNPTGIALDTRSREVLVSDYGDLGPGQAPRVLVFGYDGSYRASILGDGGPTGQYFGRPQGLALGSNPTHLFVVDCWRGEVVVMDRQTGLLVGTLGSYGKGPGQLLLPMDAAIVGPAMDLYVVSNRTQRLEIFAEGGTL